MLCAIQLIGTGFQNFSGKMSLDEDGTEDTEEASAVLTASPTMRKKEYKFAKCHDTTKIMEPNPVTETPKQQPTTKDETPKKKKKWKRLNTSEVGFNLSLFPRPSKTDNMCDQEDEVFNKIDADIEEMIDLVSKVPKSDKSFTDLVEGSLVQQTKYTRKDKHRRCQKASVQIKDKYCRSLANNDGRKDLYINHRVFKKINLDAKRLHLHLPSTHVHAPAVNEQEIPFKDRNVKQKPFVRTERTAPVQNLNHTLHETNAPLDIDPNILDLLISLQHRDLSPEDYETLLQLDESVAPKTLDQNIVEQFRTDTVDDSTAGEVCAVCLDIYEIGQQRKFLPCNHVFHESCIKMWLENSSQNCPIDGLPVDGS